MPEQLTVLSPEDQLFDCLQELDQPTSLFGEVMIGQEMRERVLAEAEKAVARVVNGFSFERAPSVHAAAELENVIARMWEEGWNPNEGNLALFATDFGLTLLESLFHSFGGELVLRSNTDLTHVSLFYGRSRTEVFPFHKVIKRLRRESGESLTHFARGIEDILIQP